MVFEAAQRIVNPTYYGVATDIGIRLDDDSLAAGKPTQHFNLEQVSRQFGNALRQPATQSAGKETPDIEQLQHVGAAQQLSQQLADAALRNPQMAQTLLQTKSRVDALIATGNIRNIADLQQAALAQLAQATGGNQQQTNMTIQEQQQAQLRMIDERIKKLDEDIHRDNDRLRALGFNDPEYDKKRQQMEEQLAHMRKDSPEYYKQEAAIADLDKQHGLKAEQQGAATGNREMQTTGHDIVTKAQEVHDKAVDAGKKTYMAQGHTQAEADQEFSRYEGAKNALVKAGSAEKWNNDTLKVKLNADHAEQSRHQIHALVADTGTKAADSHKPEQASTDKKPAQGETVQFEQVAVQTTPANKTTSNKIALS